VRLYQEKIRLVKIVVIGQKLPKNSELVVESGEHAKYSKPKMGQRQRCNRGEIYGATSAMVGQNLPPLVGIGLRHLKI